MIRLTPPLRLAGLAFVEILLFATNEASATPQATQVALENYGFNFDAVQEVDGSTSADLSGDPNELNGYVLVTSGYAAANSPAFAAAGALPDDGVITTTNAVFQLQPYDENNVLVLGGQTTGTLTLAPSARSSYSEISFLVSSLTAWNHASTISFSLNYDIGDPVVFSNVPITSLNTEPAPGAIAAEALTSYVFAGDPQADGGPINLDEYDFTVSAPPDRILQSVTIDPGLDQIDVYAVSGVDPSPTPEPSTWTLLVLALGSMILLARRAGPLVPGRPAS